MDAMTAEPRDLTDPIEADAGNHYAYRASLIGGARRFDLMQDGLAFQIGNRSGIWRYDSIALVRLSFRPVSMQSRRFRADLQNTDGERLSVVSTTWQTVALMAPQDQAYRAFIVALHRKMSAAGSRAELVGGLKPWAYNAALVVLALLAVAMTGLLARAVATGEWAGIIFFLGFTALFVWQIGGFIHRNKPRRYTFDALPKELLP
uniref:Bll5862 protein n=1 Tax=Rhodopseudomonas palustris (strain BisA53) TaxID=316055 RepID=Q07RJ1_RHOP5